MKSRFLTTAFDDRESDGAKRFVRHLDELLGAADNVREACLAALPTVRAAITQHQTNKIVEELAETAHAPPLTVQHSLAVLSYLADALLSEEIPDDDHEKWADDLSEAQWLKPEQREAFESVVTILVSKLLPDLRSQADARRTRGGVLPTFKSLGITVEVRPIRKDRYRWGTPVDDYQPEIIGTTMIASIHVGVDEGFPQDLCFQADSQDVDNMIATLMATKKEMSALGRYLQLDASGKVRANA